MWDWVEAIVAAAAIACFVVFCSYMIAWGWMW